MKLYKKFKQYWRKRYFKYGRNIWTRGPFQFYRCAGSETLDISLTRFDNAPCGWEWGYKDPQRGPDKPLIEIRLGKLWVLYFEKRRHSFEAWFMGFWWIHS